MNISLTKTESGDQELCQYEGVLPWDEESRVLVNGGCSEDDFTVEISSRVFGGQHLGVTKDGEVHEIEDSRNRRGKSISFSDTKLQDIIEDVHENTDVDNDISDIISHTFRSRKHSRREIREARSFNVY